MQQPADVRRELLRFRAGQQHAVVQRVQESRLADPAPPLDQLAMHERDLAGRPAEAEPADLHPQPERLAEGDRRDCAHCVATFCGHECVSLRAVLHQA